MHIASNQNDRTIFLSVALGSFFSFVFLCIAVYYIQQNNMSAELNSRSDRFIKTLNHEVKDEASRMQLLSSSYLLESPELKGALRLVDRNMLFDSSIQTFKKLKQNFGITHMYFHDTQRINILRVHQPQRYGDLIGRVTMIEAVKTGTSSYGYELGPLGTLTLRVVTPWYDGVGLLGYVELGKELNLIVNTISKNEDIKILMAINKPFLNQQGYESQMQKKNTTSHWNEFKSVVIINSKTTVPQAIHDVIESIANSEEHVSTVIALGESYYSLSSVPLIAAGGVQVGVYYILTDITSEVSSNHTILLAIVLIGLLITVIFLVFFNSRLNISRKESNMLLQSIHSTGEAILIADRDGMIEYCNPAFTRLTGYAENEVVGQLIMNNHKLIDNQFYQTMSNSIQHGELWNGKIINRKKDGSTYPATLTISPIYQTLNKKNDRRLISHYIGIQSDLSEIESLEQQFHQSQKMEAIGTLVGGIAHDFNNMLAGISGNLHLAQQGAKGNTEVSKRLDNISTLIQRAASMIQQLLTFARKGTVSVKPVLLGSFLHDTLQLLQSSMPENIQLKQHLCDEELLVHADETQLHQVLMNLLGNARDAIGEMPNPCIRVDLERASHDDAHLNKFTAPSKQAFAHLRISDNGCGIPMENLEHLFEPFFTTKEQGKGTGLGLAMVFGAIKTHEGFIDVESLPGKGSSFHIYLPLQEKEVVAEFISSQKVSLVKGAGEVILLADDENHIVETGKVVLESLGYQVLTANNGDQATQIFAAHADEISLCVLDVVMPVMGGDEAATQIKKIKSDIKIIFATGYDKALLKDMHDETVISKPFMVDELSHLIKDKLAGKLR